MTPVRLKTDRTFVTTSKFTQCFEKSDRNEFSGRKISAYSEPEDIHVNIEQQNDGE